MLLNSLLEVNSSELGNYITGLAIVPLNLKSLMKWYEKMKCISQSYEQMRENTNYLSPPTPILFSSSEAVDETKPKGSARQDEGQGEEREADQEHA